MTTNTAKYGLGKPDGTDLVRDGDNAVAAALDLLDLLLGESGTDTITPSAVDTNTSKRINYSRSYAGLAPLVPRAMAVNDGAVNTGTTVHLWTSGEDATGFTLNIRSSTTTIRSVKWRAGV